MKVYIEDTADQQLPKAKQSKAQKSASGQAKDKKTGRGGGFKRRHSLTPTATPEEREKFTVSMTDGEFAEQEEKVETADPVVCQTDEPADNGVPEFGITVDEDTNTTPEAVPEYATEPEPSSEPEPVAEPDTVSEPEPATEPVRNRPSKKEERESRKAEQLAYEEELYRSRRSKKAAQAKTGRPSSKAKQTTKMSTSEARKTRSEMKKSGNHRVVVVSESLGSQLIVLAEVVAGAALMLFGGAQIANILINNIVSGMLGG